LSSPDKIKKNQNIVKNKIEQKQKSETSFKIKNISIVGHSFMHYQLAKLLLENNLV
jgi:hypothetical protein